MRFLFTVCLIGSLCAQPAFSEAAVTPSLEILLTNDDGWSAIGLRVLRRALQQAGHEVVLVAPNMNYSGTSAMLSNSKLEVEELEKRSYSVSGSPATCVLFGLTAVYSLEKPPDLVISGINHGANLGPSISFSGTVGAASMSLTLGVPAIAVSADPRGKPGEDPTFVEHYENVADFTAKVVTKLGQTQTDTILPVGTALNINYPPIERQKVKGVRLAGQGRSADLFPVYRKTAEGTFEIQFQALKQDDRSETDVSYYKQGYVTIMPFDNDRSLRGEDLKHLGDRLSGLSP